MTTEVQTEEREYSPEELFELDQANGYDHNWPHKLKAAAYHGLAGDIVKTIEPHSEADPASLLVQLLVSLGCFIGRNVHFVAESSCHYPNLFACLVGQTSKGRKGTSWGHINRLLKMVDEDWTRAKVTAGLSSGEGLIWEVRDPIFKQEPIREGGKKNGPVIDYQQVEVDPGISDKRLLVVESEFAQVLQASSRERNTLNSVLRNAWDDGKLRTMVKNSPATATDAHVSIIGHITQEELCKLVGETNLTNGLANRFLWVATKRSKLLPEGGTLTDDELHPFASKLRVRLEAYHDGLRIQRDEHARQLWLAEYAKLSEGKPGLVGAATSRSEAQTMRLAMIYAVLDRSDHIELPHLKAGLEVWRHCEESARYAFASFDGNKEEQLRDKLVEWIENKGGDVGHMQLIRSGPRDLRGSVGEALLSQLVRDGLGETHYHETGTKPERRFRLY